MSDSPLPMPSDLRKAADASATADDAAAAAPLPPPPGGRLAVQLFLIPLLIVAAAVGVVWLISGLTGGAPSVKQAVDRLKQGRGGGGGRTAGYLLGPGSKQLYMDAMVLAEQMRASDMTESDRVELSNGLVEVLDSLKQPSEGEVEPFLILALGRTWQVDPRQPPMESDAAKQARRQALTALTGRYRTDTSDPTKSQKMLPPRVDDANVQIRKAAVLALSYWAGRDDLRPAVATVLLRKLSGEAVTAGADPLSKPDPELDVRMAAASALGPVGAALDAGTEAALRDRVVAALNEAMDTAGSQEQELVWAAAGSLAQMNRPESKDMILMLLDRGQLSQMEYHDREAGAGGDPRKLDEAEQQRILINTMLAAQHLQDADVQARLRALADQDSSHRVREAAKQILAQRQGG